MATRCSSWDTRSACRSTAATPAPSASWTLLAPRADLYGDNGKLIVKHYVGPTWEAKDGSSVVAARIDGLTMDKTAIPWLKLKATSTTHGADGDRLTGTTWIQRVATTGGVAPDPSTCNDDTIGDTAEIPYTADYYFWKSTGN